MSLSAFATAGGPARRSYKHIFLADSVDRGVTWPHVRQLTTVHGQCHGEAVGLSGDRVVLLHDHRYPRQLSSGRAMVSLDDGQIWEDEVYYLPGSYTHTVTLDGEEMLSIFGYWREPTAEMWEHGTEPPGVAAHTGKCRAVIIRWRLA